MGIGAVADAQHRAGQPVVAGQQRHAARRGSELLALQPRLRGGRLGVQPRSERRLVEHVQRQGVVGIGGETNGWRSRHGGHSW